MTPLPERQYLVSLINDATANGARKAEACRTISLSIRTLQRWVKNGVVCGDERASAVRPTPSNKLSKEERKKIVDLCNEPEFASLTPNQIVPTLADRGIYHASEASFYRILKDHDLLAKRVRSRPKGHHKKPRAQTATAPNQVWTWDSVP
ncbi:helix-turn-helix domain-containing protein [Zhongshania sp. BJYM1]|uniref:helix-turn-helix domain-containing protein n=1 Tax=Zhongshania aquatica TaxID=2965069 RepID=UPI0022B4B245|nr:helix-turn-helix domain-containing protein [Marortus sp. BJYM1]